MKPEDQPLEVKVENGQLTLRIGIDVLADAIQRFEPFNVYDDNKGNWRDAWLITDHLEFAKDVRRMMEDEFEDGSSLLTNFLEKVAEKVLDYGSLGVTEGEPKWPEPFEEEDSE